MEQELKLWLGRFPVPVMVSSFDATESLIRLPEETGSSHLMGYVDPKDGSLVTRLGLFENGEMPAAQMTSEHFRHVYRDLPFKLRRDVETKVEREQRHLRLGWASGFSLEFENLRWAPLINNKRAALKVI
jgi:hypothetical protein